jgi:hypothetical protein
VAPAQRGLSLRGCRAAAAAAWHHLLLLLLVRGVVLMQVPLWRGLPLLVLLL